jgi:hypothetical protein
VGFVVDKVALRQVFSEYFGLHYINFSTITITYHPRLEQYASKWPLNPKSHRKKLKKKKKKL